MAGIWPSLLFTGPRTERLARREQSIQTQNSLLAAHRQFLAAQAQRNAQRAMEAGWDQHSAQKTAIEQLSTAATKEAQEDVASWAKTYGSSQPQQSAEAKAAAAAVYAKPQKPEPKGAYLEEIDEEAEKREAEAAAAAAAAAEAAAEAKLKAEAAAEAAAAAQRAAEAKAKAKRGIWEDDSKSTSSSSSSLNFDATAAAASATAAAAGSSSGGPRALPPIRPYARIEVKFTARPRELATTAAREDTDRKTLRSVRDWNTRHTPQWLTAANSGLHPDAVTLKDRADRFFQRQDLESAASAYSNVIQIQLNGAGAVVASGGGGTAGALGLVGGSVPPSLYANRSACYLALAQRASPNATEASAPAPAPISGKHKERGCGCVFSSLCACTSFQPLDCG